MKDVKFLLILILVFIMAFAVIFSFRLYHIEQTAKNRYLSTVVAIDFTRDRVKALDKKIDEVIENTRPLTWDELMEEAMSFGDEILLPDNKIDSWEELEILLTDLCKFVGYDINK